MAAGLGGQLDATNAHGWSAVHLAALVDAPGLLRALAAAGAPTGARNDRGQTALHVAAFRGAAAAAAALLALGGEALAAAEDAHGRTAHQLACLQAVAPGGGGWVDGVLLVLGGGACPPVEGAEAVAVGEAAEGEEAGGGWARLGRAVTEAEARAMSGGAVGLHGCGIAERAGAGPRGLR